MDDNEVKKQTVFKSPDQQENNQADQTSSGMSENLLGMLAYLGGIISGIIVLVVEKENKFVRFHAFQSIFTFVAVIVLSIVISFIPFVGWIFSLLLTPVILILWLFLMYKAYQGEEFKLPFVGDLAEKQVG